MNIILLSGGSGKRLWPLSNDTRSKQFLQLLKNDAGEYESMVQRVYSQIREVNKDANILVATSATQVDSIQNQLGKKVELVIEPERRNTFPAIALSCAYLALEKKVSMDETIIVLPVDPYAELEYFEVLNRMDEAVQQKRAEMVLMGIHPTYPSSKYGYIIPDKEVKQLTNSKQVMDVKCFVEKPTEEKAESLLKDGAFWNGGVFAFKLGYLMNIIKDYIQVSNYTDMVAQYSTIKKNSFDYEIVEKANSIAMVTYDNTWKDLGTWNTLTEEMDSSAVGQVVLGEDCVNTHVINELSIPLVVLGASDMIIAASPDGILVSDKHKSSYIKPYVEDLNERPMFEERRWGEYKVLDYTTFEDGTKTLTKHLTMNPGESIS